MLIKIRLVYLLILLSYFNLSISCKAGKDTASIELDNYKIVNVVLNAIETKHQDSIAFDPLSNNKIYNDVFNLNNIINIRMYSSCSRADLRESLRNFSQKGYELQFELENIKWATDKIENPKVKVGFKLESTKNIEQYYKEKEKFNKEFDRDYALQLFWGLENNEPIIQVSNPVWSKKGNYSLLLTSSNHFGVEAWILKKTKEKWLIVCNKQIALI